MLLGVYPRDYPAFDQPNLLVVARSLLLDVYA